MPWFFLWNSSSADLLDDLSRLAHLWWQKNTFPWFQVSQEWLRCLNSNSPWAHVLALTGKRKDSQSQDFFVQSLFLLVTGLKKRKDKDLIPCDHHRTHSQARNLTQKCSSLRRKWLNNPSIHYKPGSVSFSPISSSVFSRAASATRALPPQGSPASSLGWTRGATIHQRRQTGNSSRGEAAAARAQEMETPRIFVLFALCEV